MMMMVVILMIMVIGDDDDDDCERLVPVVARRKTFTTGCGGSRPAGKRSLPKKKATL